jgi:hypothetical protein
LNFLGTKVWATSPKTASFRAQTPVSTASIATIEVFPPEVWGFQVGGYQVCGKWLKDRRGRQLSYDDLTVYQKIIVALKETIRLMEEVDGAVGEWPLE